jgi:hypothetical protein
MRPLDAIEQGPEPEPDLALVRPKQKPRREPEPEPAKPRRFKVVDVITGAIAAEHASTRATVELLERVRRIGDVQVYVWNHEAERWRLLTLGEQRTLWGLRHRARREEGHES